MSAFQGMEELLQDFLTEASELLSDVDNKLVELEKRPDDRKLLNDIFRGFHTIKGGAGFLNVTELVALCHLTENLFDKLRTGEMALDAAKMDVILEATGAVRNMFGSLAQSAMPQAASPALLGGFAGNAGAAKGQHPRRLRRARRPSMKRPLRANRPAPTTSIGRHCMTPSPAKSRRRPLQFCRRFRRRKTRADKHRRTAVARAISPMATACARGVETPTRSSSRPNRPSASTRRASTRS